MTTKEEQSVLREAAMRDEGFQNWVDLVSPGAPVAGAVKEVWLPELFAILQLLWEIYQWLVAKGWIKSIIVSWKVSRALRRNGKAAQQFALQIIKSDYKI